MAREDILRNIVCKLTLNQCVPRSQCESQSVVSPGFSSSVNMTTDWQKGESALESTQDAPLSRRGKIVASIR